MYSAIDQVFVQPERLIWLWLVGGAVLAIVVGELLRALGRRRLFALAQEQRAGTFGDPWRQMLSGTRIMALILIVLALADPRTGSAAIEMKTSKLQIVCLLDRSRSMMARDVSPSRFEAGRNVVRDAVDLAGGAAVALTTFAGDARVDMPLTRDYQGLLDRLDGITPDNSPTTGTNLAAGLVTAAACFAERIESPKILIVVTDGETHGVEPELPDDSLPTGTDVLVLGVGDPRKGARIPLDEEDHWGSNDGEFLMHEGKIVWSKANQELLNRLAKRLDGRFQRMEANSSTAAILDMLRRAESTAAEDLRLAYRRQAAPRFHWLLLAAAGLICLEAMLPSKKPAAFGRRRPARPGLVKHLMRWTVLALFPVLTAPIGLADAPSGTVAASQRSSRELSQLYNRGVEAYRAGQWSDAESLFRTVSREAEGSLRVRATFNLANTHYTIVHRGGVSKREAIRRLEAAIGLFRQVIAEGERTEDARANIEIVYRRLLQIQQQQPDSEGDMPPPADETPDQGDSSQDEGGDSDEDGSNQNKEDEFDGGDSGDQPQGNGDPGGGNGRQSGEPDADASFGSAPPDAGRPPDAPSEPLTDEQAEDQLSRIRQRAQDRRRERDQDDTADAVPTGLPW